LKKKLSTIKKPGAPKQFLPKKKLIHWYEGAGDCIYSNPVAKIESGTRRKIKIIYYRIIDRKTGELGRIQEIKVSNSKK
jgi:hypothetical protein